MIETNEECKVGGNGMGLTFSIILPIPETVIARPPNICVASSAVSRPFFEMYLQGDRSKVYPV